jgi:hypothetical protein
MDAMDLRSLMDAMDLRSLKGLGLVERYLQQSADEVIE